MANILVLGGTRFFGKHLVEQLIEQKHDVTVATRGISQATFEGNVTRVTVDRTNEREMKALFAQQTFDIVYDNICYTPQQAKIVCDALQGANTKVVFTSTMATYAADGQMKKEEDFDPYHYSYQLNTEETLSYGEGKKQAEAFYTANATFPVTIVRFPIVMGTDDYTERLSYYVKHIMTGEPIELTNMEAQMGFISSVEAGAFLGWIGFQSQEGIWNAVSHGTVTLRQLIAQIEKISQNKATIVEGTNSPYSIPNSWYMDNEKAKRAGFSFSNLEDWLTDLITYYVKRIGN
ncbi:NAD-dependent epimerase/dehydratase family protein [Kurthia senegalensis]|uniref:NAD-dependent epimerase/dehydratase family protein n=1 Tax=Kurthia senegalensis TaxID=1033740 RepID=UPI000289A0FE|nr:NAD-dependent epimerase/dehydratase family protein [Kurthia senegalensis]